MNAETALKNPTVYACVKVIAETLATLPLHLYKRGKGETRDIASEHALYQVLRLAPNPRMTSLEFREMMTGHYLLQGNAYAQIIRNGAGEIHSLWPLHPSRMEVLALDSGEAGYLYTKADGQKVAFKAEQIFHLRGPSDDGLKGRSQIDCFKEAVGLSLAVESYNSNFFGSNASPTGILTLPPGTVLTPKAKERLKEDWKAKFSGSGARESLAVLEEGVTWQQIGLTSVDAQLIDVAKNQVAEIARCFRMPLHKIGMMDKATYSNIEFQGIEFLTDTMLPHLARWEQVITRDLLRGEKPDKYFAEFMVNGLLRGDQESRYKSYSMGRQWGWLSTNDIRAMENLNPIEGGDIYLQPLNMIEASKASDYLMASKAPTTQPDHTTPGADPGNPTLKKSLDFEGKVEKNSEKSEESAEKDSKTAQIITSITAARMAESLKRALVKENKAAAHAEEKGKGEEFRSTFYEAHRSLVVDALTPAAQMYAGHLCGLSDGAVPTDSAPVKRAIDETVNEYYNRHKVAGDKIDSSSEALSAFLVQRLQDYCGR